MLSTSLTAAQNAALCHVRVLAERDRGAATDRAAGVLAGARIDVGVGELCARIAETGRVAVNFHPDRIATDGRTVLEALLEDGAAFRGPQVSALSRRVAAELGDVTGRIDAELVGRAARLVAADPNHFADHVEPVETLQHLKQLWHVLVAYGRPAD